MKINSWSIFKHFIFKSGILLSLFAPQAMLQATWQPAVVVSNPSIPTSGLGGPVLAVNPQGNAVAVWTDTETPTLGNESAISSSFYTRGVGWSMPQVISSLALNPFNKPLYVSQGDPDVAMNASNYAVAVWEGEFADEPFNKVIIAAFSSSGIWSPVENISASLADNRAFNANVAVNASGLALAAWRETLETDSGFEDHTTVSFLPFGGFWTPPLIISGAEEALGDRDNKPYVQINDSGQAVVIWTKKFADGSCGISVATYNPNTATWSPPLTLDTTPLGFDFITSNPRCAIDPNGNAMAIWGIRPDITTSLGTIKAAYFNGTAWQTPEILDIDAVIDSPSVVMDADGNSNATWENSGTILYAFRPFGGDWGPSQVISTGTGNHVQPFMSQEPLAVDKVGNVIAIWLNGVSDVISANKIFGSSWNAPETVFSGFDEIYPSVGLAACGFAVALWHEGQGSSGLPPAEMAAVNENILIPQNPKHKLGCCQLCGDKKCLNILSWGGFDCVLAYNIRRNGKLIATVTSHISPLGFIDPCKCKKRPPCKSESNKCGCEKESHCCQNKALLDLFEKDSKKRCGNECSPCRCEKHSCHRCKKEYCRCKKKARYTISSINMWGFESDQVPFIFKHKFCKTECEK